MKIKLLILGLVLFACKEQETCHLCINTQSLNGEEISRAKEVNCGIDFKTVEDLERLSSYKTETDSGTVVTRLWCRRYEHND